MKLACYEIEEFINSIVTANKIWAHIYDPEIVSPWNTITKLNQKKKENQNFKGQTLTGKLMAKWVSANGVIHMDCWLLNFIVALMFSFFWCSVNDTRGEHKTSSLRSIWTQLWYGTKCNLTCYKKHNKSLHNKDMESF